MPEQRAFIGVLAARFAVLIKIGQHVDLRVVLVAMVLAQHVDLHLAEVAREGDLRRRRQIDVVEQDQLIGEKRFVDFGEYCRRDRFRKRNAGNLTTKNRMQRPDLKRPNVGRRSRFQIGLGHDTWGHDIGGMASIRRVRAGALCHRPCAVPRQAPGCGGAPSRAQGAGKFGRRPAAKHRALLVASQNDQGAPPLVADAPAPTPTC